MLAAETANADALDTAAGPGMPQLDLSTWGSQIFWLILTFGVLYFVLAKFILPVIGSTVADRTDRIADDLDTAATMQREAEEAEKSYETSLRDARAKARNVAESTRESVDAEVASEIADADLEAERAALVAEERIRDIRSAAMANIDTAARDTADAIVAKLVPSKTLKA